ncbi:C-type lectin domain family 9 member A-like [Mobula birostris]|uniref:C-type lectin domain family 9 member A-like n=1 Tax=Mobula birostris TaxID=1983395 RepID=UPI003B27B3BC
MGSERSTWRDRSDSSIWLIGVLTATLIITGICWRIHVSQIRHSLITFDREHQKHCEQYQEMNSTQRQCGLQISDLEMKYHTLSEVKAQICQLLFSRKKHTCSEEWIQNKDRCYYVSMFDTSYNTAVQECSNRNASLLEIKSRDEASFLSQKLVYRYRAYWIGKCEDGNVGPSLLYSVFSRSSVCLDCNSHLGNDRCNRDWRFICEKSAPLFPGVPEKIKDLCRQPLEET